MRQRFTKEDEKLSLQTYKDLFEDVENLVFTWRDKEYEKKENVDEREILLNTVCLVIRSAFQTAIFRLEGDERLVWERAQAHLCSALENYVETQKEELSLIHI